ncbi:hypothetical protein [Falsiruegeria mediterranea]|uniref:hypothetical protein n=1 Tax=Falsiruegeria mediterranea TaxID=1280832 RepID=UPI000D56166B|nr:hypothetical protein [Falsiruegeria mediterranea]
MDDDTLNGGAGLDFVIFDGNRADYTITRSSTTDVRVTGTDGTDSLISVEYFQFDDETANIWQFAIASGGNQNKTPGSRCTIWRLLP